MSALVADTSGQFPRPDKRRFGRYVLHYRVAQGGMAAVYLARIQSPEGFEKWVAVKAILPHLAAEKSFVDMFLSEARLVARLDHPNICSVFDFGEAEGTYYLAMEYLHGEPLSALQRRVWPAQGFPPELAGRIVADAAHGLHAAHELCTPDGRSAEVVHRDVSPQNIFVLYSGVTKVVDFGIARSNDRGGGERTEQGLLKGKLAYMSPEHIREQRVDRRTDVFALGVVLWEITVGQRLFRRDVEVDTLMAVLRDDIPTPSSLREGYPARLEAIVMRALERDPAARYQTAGELARDLESFLVGTGRPSGQAAVAEFMQATFARQIAQRNNLLQRRTEEHEGPEIVATASTHVPAAIAGLRARRAGAWRGPALAGASAVALLASIVAVSRSPSARAPAAQPLVTPAATAHPGESAPPERDHEPVAPHAVAPLAPAASAPRNEPAPEPSSATPAPAPATQAPEPLPSTARAGGNHAGDDAAEHGPPGFLNLVAIPTATVFEGGRLLGTTPLVRRALAPGAHTLRLVPVQGGDERRIQVRIRSGRTQAASLRWP